MDEINPPVDQLSEEEEEYWRECVRESLEESGGELPLNYLVDEPSELQYYIAYAPSIAIDTYGIDFTGSVLADLACTIAKENVQLDSVRIKHMSAPEGQLQTFMEALASNGTLREFCMEFWEPSKGELDAMVSMVSSTSSCLRKMGLYGVPLGDEGATLLAHALATNTSLQELTVTDGQIAEAGGEALGKALACNNTLCRLDLWGNGSVGYDGVMHIARGLQTNTTLSELKLPFCFTGLPAAGELGLMLRVNHTLRSLDIQCNEVGWESVVHLLDSLKRNCGLQTLNLSENGAKMDACLSLRDTLTANTTLTALYFDNNRIGDEGAELVAKGLAQNNTLKHITLARNRISDQGVSDLAAVLATNTTLRSLSLEGNPFGDIGLRAVCTILLENTTMHSVRLVGKECTVESVDAVADVLANNRSLMSFIVGSRLFDGDEAALATLKAAAAANYTLRKSYVDSLSPIHKRNNKLVEDLHTAIAEDDLISVVSLLDKGVHPDASISVDSPHPTAPVTPVQAAVEARAWRIAQTLIARGADVPSSLLLQPWTTNLHCVHDSTLDLILETALLMNSTERDRMFLAGGMESYSTSALWSTVPDEVMERVIGWLVRRGGERVRSHTE